MTQTMEGIEHIEDDDAIFNTAESPMPQLPSRNPAPQQQAPQQPQSELLTLLPTDRAFVIIEVPQLQVRIQARKVVLQEDSVGLILASEECDLTLSPTAKYTLTIGEEIIETIYVGGKVEFAPYTLVTFIRKPADE